MDPGLLATLLLLGILVVSINLFCLTIIAITPTIRRPSVIAVGNLLFTHFLQGVVVIPFYILKRWKFQDPYLRTVFCDGFRLSYMVTNYASCLTLLVIAVDRLVAAFRPLRYRQIVTKRRIFLALFSTWIYVIVLCLLPFIPLEKKGKCNYVPRKTWTIAMLIGNTLVPFMIISGCYIYVFKVAKNVIHRKLQAKRERNPKQKRTGAFQRIGSLREVAAAKMSLMIVIAYVLCWGPSFFYYLISSLCSACFDDSFYDSDIEKIMTFLMKTLTFFDGIVAPLIYCYKHSGFRLALRRLRRRIRGQKAINRTFYTETLPSNSESAV